MKIITLILGTLLTFSAHASINNFEGHFTVVSGDTNYGSCQDFDVVYDTTSESLKVINSKSNYVVVELGNINKGRMPWMSDLGDIVLKGTKKVVYDGKGHISYDIKRGLGLFTYRKFDMTIVNDTLTLDYDGDKVCVLKR
jgi:hypothetical protein